MAVSCSNNENHRLIEKSTRHRCAFVLTYLGHLKEGLGDIDDAAHLLDRLDTLLDGTGVVGTGGVQDVPDLGDLAGGPLGVHGARILSDSGEDGEQTESDDSLLVHYVEFVRNSCNRETGSRRQDCSLRDERVARESIDDGLRLSLGVRRRRRDVRLVTCSEGDRRQPREGCN